MTLTRSSLAALLLMTVPVWAEVPRVVADTPINHALAALVMGDLDTPEVLLDRGGDPHASQLRPSQARSVARADLVIWSGDALTPWMRAVAESLASGRVLDLSQVAGLTRQPFADVQHFGAEAPLDAHEDHDDDHDHDHDHDHEGSTVADHASDEDEHAGHTHRRDEIDPHFWMNTGNAALWIEVIAAELGAIDPANSAVYQANAARAVAEVSALRTELAEILAPVGAAGLVMYHDAYGYFATEFGLTVVGTIAAGDAAAPGAARVMALRASLSDASATCVFPEANQSDAYARVVTEGSALRLGAALDPAGVTLEPGPDLYARTLRQIAQAIADCVAGR